jgi:ankyrin repeat protein
MQRRQILATGAAAGLAVPIPARSLEKLDSQKFREAALAGDLVQVASYLDRDPALMHSRDVRGDSVYSLAALAGQTKVAAELVRRGLQPDIFEASASGDPKRVRELLAASPGLARVRSASGRTPLHYAAAGGRTSRAPPTSRSGWWATGPVPTQNVRTARRRSRSRGSGEINTWWSC